MPPFVLTPTSPIRVRLYLGLCLSQHLYLPMFSLANRFQTLANQTLTAVSVLTVAIAIISIVQLYLGGVWDLHTTTIANVRAVALLKNLRTFGALGGKQKENSKIAFDLSADLTPLFQWNTKQVFVYLTAEYDGKKPGYSSRVTYWDKIITSKDNAVLDLKNVRAKYSVWDVEKSFRERNATLRLEWSIQPYVGAFVSGETLALSNFTFAKLKKSL